MIDIALSKRLLRGHVVESAEHRASVRERPCSGCFAIGRRQFGNPEVEDFDG
jgi:hypothetical protein